MHIVRSGFPGRRPGQRHRLWVFYETFALRCGVSIGGSRERLFCAERRRMFAAGAAPAEILPARLQERDCPRTILLWDGMSGHRWELR